MTERMHGIGFVVAMGMMAYGLWRIDPSAMFIGIGSILLVLLVVARNSRNRQHGRSNKVA